MKMHHKQSTILFTALFVCSLAATDIEPSTTTNVGSPAAMTGSATPETGSATLETTTTMATATSINSITTTAQIVTAAGELSQMANETCDNLLAKMRAMVFLPEAVVLNVTNSTIYCSSHWNTAKQYKEKCMKTEEKMNEAKKYSFYLEVLAALCASNQTMIGFSDDGNKCFTSLKNVTLKCTNGSYSYPSEIGVGSISNANCADTANKKNCIVSGLKEHCSVDQQKALGGLINTMMAGKCDNATALVSTTATHSTTTPKPRNSGVDHLSLAPFAFFSTILMVISA